MRKIYEDYLTKKQRQIINDFLCDNIKFMWGNPPHYVMYDGEFLSFYTPYKTHCYLKSKITDRKIVLESKMKIKCDIPKYKFFTLKSLGII